MKTYFLFILSILVFSCAQKKQENGNYLVNSIETAHKKEAFLKEQAIRFRLELTFGGKERFKGTISQLTNSSKIRLDYDNGLTLIFDNNKVYQTPDSVDYPKVRFDMFTWSYFFALPYKLSDPGTQWTAPVEDTLNETLVNAAQLTFTAETGDSPKDWYIVYQNKSNSLLQASAYIVTLNKSVKEAEEDPHAIKYEEYIIKNGIPFASKWTFWGWSKEDGLTQALGEGHLSNFEFFTPKKGYFSKPEQSKIIPL